MPDTKTPFHPALAVSNIKNHVTVTLGMDNDRYPLWVALFTNHAKSNRVLHHIVPPRTGGPKAPVTAEEKELWETLDATVLQWIYATVSTDLLETIVEQETTAKECWDRIRDIFQDNQHSRAVTLEQEFSHTAMADFPNASAYCQRLKTLSDQLKNVGAPVSNSRLVLQMVSGLTEAYQSVGSIIRQANPLPHFYRARSMITLEEAGLAKTAATGSSSSAMYVKNNDTSDSILGRPPQSSQKGGKNQGNKKKGGGYKGNKGQSNQQGSNSGGAVSTAQAAPVAAGLWQGQGYGGWPWGPWGYPPCPYPTTPWTRSPRPQYTPRPPVQAYSAENPPSQTDIEAAMYTLGIHPPDPNWFMDTGATSHMTASPGTLSSYFNSSIKNGIIVGNGKTIPISGYGQSKINHPTHPLILKNVIHAPDIVKNLVSVRYPDHHRGYKCYDIKTKKIIICRHVIFDESRFPFSEPTKSDLTTYNFLDDVISPYVLRHLTQGSTTNPTQHDQPASPPHEAAASDQQPTPSPTAAASDQQPAPTTAPHATPSSTIVPPSKAVTRGDYGIRKPKTIFDLHNTVSISPIPKTPLTALKDTNWKMAMDDEFNALISNKTWELVPRPTNVNVIRSMWIFRHKFQSNGSFERHKARLVGDGKTQRVGIDCGETFSPVVKPATIRTVLSLALASQWSIHQLDVKNAFLHDDLSETVYMHQPMGYRDSRFPDHVCLLRKSLYGLKQAPRAWYKRFADFVTSIGFRNSKCDHSLFIYKDGNSLAYLLLYVDDIILTTSSDTLRLSIMSRLRNEFAMKDLGLLHYFLGIAVSRRGKSMFLSQSKYANEIIEKAGMSMCKPCSTPVDTKPKLSSTCDQPCSDASLYRSLAGALQYLTFTRPDLSYAVQQLCLFMHNPMDTHMNALKRVIRYVKGTLSYGLWLGSSSPTSLMSYTDADWAGCPDTRCSTSGYCVFLGDNLISWASKRQPTLSRSSAEAEYRGVANVVSESCWLRNLLLELHHPLPKATIVYCDNVSAIYLSGNPVQHQRTKHIELDIHFVREKVARGEVRVLHVPTRHQIADIFTKGLPLILFDDFRSSLNVRQPPDSTAGVC
ncbi:uncharacterized protein LOC141648591 [Silene latifolia]|uniref:uncharacterized protein LOC141648591 n=1 Tax=Silene latifolia TaxID=37657 RepID=UPI003D76DA41